MMRTVDELTASAHAVIDRGFFMGGMVMMPLFSGGHDSLCACHVASQHKKFTGSVHHIDTGIGAKYTRAFVDRVCQKYGWTLHVYKSPSTYEQYVAHNGFPGPGSHRYVYARLKERCVRMICKSKMPRLLISGCRSLESARRMGYVQPVQVGEKNQKTGELTSRKRIWTAPCHDWSKAEQEHYMDEMGLPVNRLKVALGMSGECFCGAYAKPFEIDAIREHAPEVAAEIERLTVVAKASGKPCIWGQAPSRTAAEPAPGPLCHSCVKSA